MSILNKKWYAMVGLATGLAAVANVNAKELPSVSCNVTIDYLLNGTVRAPYQNEFVILPGQVFEHDFSSATRFRYLIAESALSADGSTTVDLTYYNDVGVFEAVDFRTTLTIRDDKAGETDSGSNTYWSSLGVAGDHTTNYDITCSILKN